MSDEWVQSLCASVITESGSPRLFRIADLRSNEFTPNEEFDDENNNIIFHITEDFPAYGDITLWRWKSASSNFKTYEIDKSINWIEHIKLSDASQLSDIKRKLIEGIENISSSHDYLFEYGSSEEGSIDCAFVYGKDLEPFTDIKSRIKQSVLTLDICSVPLGDLRKVDTSDVRVTYFTKRQPPKIARREALYAPSAIVKRVILNRIREHTIILSENSLKTVNEFLNIIPDSDIAEEIASLCSITMEESKFFMDSFLSYCEDYMSCDDISSKLLKRLIQSDPETAKKYRQEIEQNWEEENAYIVKELEKAKEERSKAVEELDSAWDEASMLRSESEELQNELRSMEDTLKTYQATKEVLEETISELQAQYENRLAISNEIVSKLRQKVSDAKAHITDFFSDYALFGSKAQAGDEGSLSNARIGVKIAQDPRALFTAGEAYDLLKDNLALAGVPTVKQNALAAYLLAAYLTKTPLFLSGFGSEAVLDALSATLLNKTATIAYSIEKHDYMLLSELAPNEIIGVYDGMENPYISRFMSSQNSPFIALLSVTNQNMANMPKSMFSYALPLFCDSFIETVPIEGFIGAVSDIDHIGQITEHLGKPQPQLRPLPEAARRRASIILTAAQSLASLSDYDTILLQTMPILLSLNEKEALASIILSSSCKGPDREYLLSLAGDTPELTV